MNNCDCLACECGNKEGCLHKTAAVSDSPVLTGSVDKTIAKGTWYQSAVSGLWYECDCKAAEAAGEISQVRIDGKSFVPLKDLV